MRQFLAIKEEHPDGVLFFRCGDFYEMFFEDAVIAAEALDLTLTSRDKGKEDAVPMAGIPHHAARGYIARLTEQGHKVVLAEQMEDPKLAKGLVKREVVRIITPGIVVDDEVLDPKSSRFFAALVPGPRGIGLAALDVSTGEFRATTCADDTELIGELARLAPREIIGTASALAGPVLAGLRARFRECAFTAVDECSRDEAGAVLESALAASSEELGLSEQSEAAQAAAQAVAYARHTQPAGQLPLTRLHVYRSGDAVVLDEAAVANLELTQTLIGGKRSGSLLSVIDRTCTAPGGRMLRRWLLYPLTDVAPIRRRQDGVEFLVHEASRRRDLRDSLKHIYDLERLGGRVSLGVATPRDLGQLRASLRILPRLAEVLDQRAGQGRRRPKTAIEVPELLQLDGELLARLAKIVALLEDALVDEPPATTKDGGVIRDGYSSVIDENRRLAHGGKEAILEIEERERQRTGIPSLKVKYNRVFGYYIEVTRSHLARVPEDYIRKQTIATAERFVTTELAELESKIIAAQEVLVVHEGELFTELCAAVGAETAAVIAAGQQVAAIDCCAGLAEVAQDRAYVRPEVDDSEVLDIVDGRHPVVEATVAAGSFVPNGCHLDTAGEQILLITGPNMAGKSTYMRQVAQIALLAQMGSFVPAAAARVGLVDRIFTRVGASDNLARGESTFMVEMRETAAIVAGATRKSLVVLDEVGRGTSTYDGVSIAWAVTEYLHDAIGCRTLFATHYHELCALAENRERIRNRSVAVREHKGTIVFMRQVVDGGANRSYGIDVARLAGLPRTVVGRARQILATLENDGRLAHGNQLTLFAAPPPSAGAETAHGAVLERIRALDPHRTTPLEALSLLAELQAELR